MKGRPAPPSRAAALALLIALLAGAPGCFVPTPESNLLWGRGVVPKKATASFREGETTREEVLLRLGAPDLVTGGERIFVYGWGVQVGAVVIWQGSVPIPASRCVVLEFDPGGRLRRLQRFDGSDTWSPRVQVEEALRAWPSPEGGGLGDLVVGIDPLPDLWTSFPAPSDAASASRIRVGEFRDARPAPYAGTLIGRQWEGTIGGADIHAPRPAGEIVKALVARQLERDGGQRDERGVDWTLTGAVEVFKAEQSAVELEIAVEARSSAAPPAVLLRRYRSTAARSALTGIGLEDTLRRALLDLQEQVSGDWILKKRLGLRR